MGDIEATIEVRDTAIRSDLSAEDKGYNDELERYSLRGILSTNRLLSIETKIQHLPDQYGYKVYGAVYQKSNLDTSVTASNGAHGKLQPIIY